MRPTDHLKSLCAGHPQAAGAPSDERMLSYPEPDHRFPGEVVRLPSSAIARAPTRRERAFFDTDLAGHPAP